MRRTSAALAASATVFALLLSGCSDDTSTSSASATGASASSAAKPAGDAAQIVDSAKAGTFVVSFKSAFPKLAQGKSDTQISEILNQTCSELKSGKSEDAVINSVVSRAKNGSTEATKEEAAAIYQMAKLMCG
ncbi:hypothetical protein [Nocardia sp. NPDC005366]|uniref:hypothetical protein n=1 Tax=Nocardia sp. NPDC005366 TaxID=3156878 RepID=UPI0033AB6F38